MRRSFTGWCRAVRAHACLVLLLASSGCRDGVPVYEPEQLPPPGDVRQLTFGYGREHAPSWSSGSDTVYYATDRSFDHPSRRHMLLQVSVDGGAARILEGAAHQVGSHGGSFALTAPVLSRDGNRMAYVHVSCLDVNCNQVAEVRLRVRSVGSTANAAADPWKQLVFSPPVAAQGFVEHMLFRPSWSPEGDRIAYADTDGVWIWAPGDSLATHVTGTSAGWHTVAWSPAGDELAVTRVSAGDTLVGRIALDTNIFTPVAAGRDPAWTGDGLGLFVATAEGVRRITLASGTSVLVPNTNGARVPAPSPDGRWLAFVRPKGVGLPVSRDNDVWAVRID